MALRGFFAPFPIDPSDHPGTIASGLYPVSPQANAAASVQAANRYFCAPWMADFDGPIKTIGVSVGTGGTVASSMKVALVGPNLTTMQPTGQALASNNAGINVAGTGIIGGTVPDLRVRRGQLYFVVSVFTWDTAAPTVVVQSNSSHAAAILLGTGLGPGFNTSTQGWRFDGTFANDIAAIDFGAQTYTAVTGANMPLMYVGV